MGGGSVSVSCGCRYCMCVAFLWCVRLIPTPPPSVPRSLQRIHVDICVLCVLCMSGVGREHRVGVWSSMCCVCGVCVQLLHLCGVCASSPPRPRLSHAPSSACTWTYVYLPSSVPIVCVRIAADAVKTAVVEATVGRSIIRGPRLTTSVGSRRALVEKPPPASDSGVDLSKVVEEFPGDPLSREHRINVGRGEGQASAHGSAVRMDGFFSTSKQGSCHKLIRRADDSNASLQP